MGKEILTFSYIEIKKMFYSIKIPVHLRDIDIEKVLVFDKISFGEKNYKYFIGYLHIDHKGRQLRMMLPKTRAYVKRYYGQTKSMCFLIEDDNLLKKIWYCWDKVRSDIKKEFYIKPVYNKEFLKTKKRWKCRFLR